MRTFTLGGGTDRKVVTVEVRGNVLRVTQTKAEGVGKRDEKEFAGEAEARSAAERMARELLTRGYAERAAAPKARQTVPAARKGEPDGLDLGALAAAGEGVAAAEPVLPRITAPAVPAAEAAPKKKKKKKSGKKKAAAGGGDGLDQRVLAAVGFVGVALVSVVGFLVYEAFLKPASIVGHWEGSRLDFEIGRPMVHTQYRLILDDQRRAEMTLQEKFTSKGTYSLQGDRLKLALKDEGGDPDQVEYKVSLGRATLDLFDPKSGKKMVQLVRFRQEPSVGGGGGAPAPSAPNDAAAGPADKAADERLASVQFSPKDGAFKLRHPAGWTPETGSRPDNTYSWARFTKDSAKIQVYADIAGSLMAGASNVQHEKGSSLAPVHGAHVNYQKTVSKEYSDFKESEPTLFEGAGLGEGRIATYTASAGGLFGGKIRGYRVTLLSNDRRVTLLCECPEGEFEKYKPTFLAVCRSASR